MVEYYLELIRQLGLETSNQKMEFFLNQNDDRLADEWLRKMKVNLEQPIIAIAPGGGESWGKDARLKRWPAQNFAVLLQKILPEQVNAGTILVFGSKNERHLGDEVSKHVCRTVFNLCGEIPIRVTASLMKRSIFLLANDSGLAHLAHALDVPVISIFGPVDPKVYGPHPKHERAVAITNEGPECRPCYQRFRYQGMCVGVECLNQLTPENVYQQIERSHFLNFIKRPVLR